MRRKTHEEYVEDLRNANPHLHIQDRYVNNRTKITIKDDRCGHIWKVLPSTPLRGIGCPYCSKRYKRTYDEFIKDLYLINKNIVILTKKNEYINSSTKVKCKCLIDGHEWMSLPSALLQGKGCPKCYGIISEEEFINKLSETKSSIILYGKYLGSKTKTTFMCLNDGFVWDTTPYHVLHNSGCPMCANKMQSERQTLSHEEYLKRLKQITNSILPINQYVKNDVPILHKCLKCNYEWEVSPNSLISERVGCPKCNCTKGENRIIKFLEDNNIDFVFQKKFDGLKNINSLYYDFYIPELNVLVEYDGEFHYIDIFKNNSFEPAKMRDVLKDEYAKNNNIKLIRIPYWDFDNIETILKTQLTG